MGDNDNSTSGYGGYGGSDTDTDSSYGGGYDGGYGGGDDDGNDDDGSDTGSYGNDGDSNDDYGGYDDSNDNSSYSEAAETLGVSKQTADELYDMQEYFLSCNGVRKDLGKLAINEITKTNIVVDGIGVAKNLYTAMSDQYKGMMEQMEKRNDNASD